MFVCYVDKKGEVNQLNAWIRFRCWVCYVLWKLQSRYGMREKSSRSWV